MMLYLQRGFIAAHIVNLFTTVTFLFQKQLLEVFFKISVLKDFEKFTRKQFSWSFFSMNTLNAFNIAFIVFSSAT